MCFLLISPSSLGSRPVVGVVLKTDSVEGRRGTDDRGCPADERNVEIGKMYLSVKLKNASSYNSSMDREKP